MVSRKAPLRAVKPDERPDEKPKTVTQAADSGTTRKRRPITEAFWDQTYDLSKRVESLERLTLDDRFGRNREVLQQQNRKHVTRAIEALQRIEDRLS